MLRKLALTALTALALALPLSNNAKAAESIVYFKGGQSCGTYKVNPANHLSIYVEAGQHLQVDRIRNVGKVVIRTDEGQYITAISDTEGQNYYEAQYSGWYDVHFLPLTWKEQSTIKLCFMDLFHCGM